jgi:hypothetical protein
VDLICCEIEASGRDGSRELDIRMFGCPDSELDVALFALPAVGLLLLFSNAPMAGGAF